MCNDQLCPLDSSAYYQDCNSLLWFVLIQGDQKFSPHPGAGENEEGLLNNPCASMIERKSRLLGSASRDACLSITDVICAPSLKCVAAAASFIEGYESDVKDSDKALNIKIEEGLSVSFVDRHSQKQFRSLAIERGYCIDQLYKSALNLQRGCSGQRSLAYDDYLRLHTTLDAIRKVCLRSATKRVVLFVDRSLEKQLKLMITDPSFKFGSFIIGSIKDTL
ncbi:hypothetical protein T4E_3655 [Trichinella pseudospiralis]|uniref:Uncharacterized protein n=1 Tax=Trichinella pseudospiralis TaxID=6337 RepID=A0A0V0XWY4_TRIPS|nr:hypothetical protein T4E_3655 [Trichinella pseudospiralis]